MGCNCKKKKQNLDKKTPVKQKGRVSWTQHIIKIFRLIVVGVLLTVGLPFIWLLLMVIVFRSYYGEPLDIAKTFKKIINKEDNKNKEEEIIPEDLELVGVDKII